MKQLEHAFTSRYWSWTYLTPEDCPAALLPALISHLRHLAPESWPARFALGGVYVNGQPVDTDGPLPIPCKIEYYEPKFELAQAEDYFPKFSEQQVLYQDDDMLVVFKPAGISCMPARDQSRFHLKAQIETYLGRIVHMPSRIDMSAQGIVVVSTSPRMHKHLQHAFQFRRIEKRYLLRVDAPASWEEREVHEPIGRDPEHPVLRKVNGKGCRPALTIFRARRRFGDGSTLLQALPHTGRTHQIRVHAAHLGVPIRGDKFYGGRTAPLLCLLSHSFTLRHPLSGKELSVEVPESLMPEWAKN